PGQSQVRVSQALARIRQLVPSHTRGRSRMRESRTYGSVRGACDETHVSSWTSLALFIQAIATQVPGDTFVGNNGTDTFIFTDTQNGQTGAVEIAGVFANNSIAGNTLTLG